MRVEKTSACKLIQFPQEKPSVRPQPTATAKKKVIVRPLNRYEQDAILAMFYDHTQSVRYIREALGFAESLVENVIRHNTRRVEEAAKKPAVNNVRAIGRAA